MPFSSTLSSLRNFSKSMFRNITCRLMFNSNLLCTLSGGGRGGGARGTGWQASTIQEGSGLHWQPHGEGVAQSYWGAVIMMFTFLFSACLYSLTHWLLTHSVTHMLLCHLLSSYSSASPVRWSYLSTYLISCFSCSLTHIHLLVIHASFFITCPDWFHSHFLTHIMNSSHTPTLMHTVLFSHACTVRLSSSCTVCHALICVHAFVFWL